MPVQVDDTSQKVLVGSAGVLCCLSCPSVHLRVAEIIGNSSPWGWGQFTTPSGVDCPTIYTERQVDISQDSSVDPITCSGSWGWHETAGHYPFTLNSGFFTAAPYTPPLSNLYNVMSNCPASSPFGPQTTVSDVYGTDDITNSSDPSSDCHSTLSGALGSDGCIDMSWSPPFCGGCSGGSTCSPDTISIDNYNHSCSDSVGSLSINVSLSNPFTGDLDAMARDEVDTQDSLWDGTFPAEDEGGGTLLGGCSGVQAERLHYKFTLDVPAAAAFTLYWAEHFRSEDGLTNTYVSMNFHFSAGDTESGVYTIDPPPSHGVTRVEHDPTSCSGPSSFPACCFHSIHE